MITPTGHIGLQQLQDLLEVALGHALPLRAEVEELARTGNPISPVKQLTMNVLAEPTGPAIR